MDFANFEEFWKALGRLYESSLKNSEEIHELRASIGDLRGSVGDLRETAALLASTVQKEHEVIMAHEHKLDRTEITVAAILEDLRRHRERRPPQ